MARMTAKLTRPGRKHAARTPPVVPAIYQTSTFELDDRAYDDITGTGGLNETWYSRFGNPTVDAAAEAITALHGAAHGQMTASGMAAIATTLVTALESGDTLVAAKQVYGDTDDLLKRDLPRMGVRVVRVDAFDANEWRVAIAEHRPAVVYGETLCNPTLRVLDIPRVAQLAHDVGATFVVDNTFASPYCARPLSLGADVVVESATKFIAGHSDVVAGAVVCDDAAWARKIQQRVITFGGCLDPHAAFLVWRGTRTFRVRLREQCAVAHALSEQLRAEPGVRGVVYPGADDYPDREVAGRVLPDARGAMLVLELHGGDERALALVRRLEVAVEATSLGGVETLASLPFNSSHFNMSAAERLAAGIRPGMVRLSVGLEGAEALARDLRRALAETAHLGDE